MENRIIHIEIISFYVFLQTLKRGEKKMDFLKRLWKEEDGQGMVEYGLIIALVAIVVIAAIVLLGGSLTGVFTKTANTLSKAISG